jgi:phosphoglucomutase
MKEVLFLLSVVAFILITGKFAHFMLNRLKKIEEETLNEIDPEVNYNEGFKEVLKTENFSSFKSTSVPQDFHNLQNLDGKYAKNVYRDKSGKFKSKKEWKNPQETY